MSVRCRRRGFGGKMLSVAMVTFVLSSLAVQAMPRLQIDPIDIDFGELEANAFVDWSCIVSNVGTTVLSVANVRACCGVSVEAFPTVLAPGTGAALRGRLNSGTLPGPFHRTVTLLSDDPERPVAVLTLAGRVRNYTPIVENGQVRLVSVGNPPGDAASAVSRALPLTLPVVLLAGLVDGFNPCAFSIVIFLAGTLAIGGRRRRARLFGGWAFCFASFATYMVMGFGLLGAIRTLGGMGFVRDVIFAALALSLFVLSALSFRDALRYRRLRVPSAITLQLPDRVKRAIRSFAEASWSGPAVVGTGLVCGVVVTLLDSLCTGQVYVPVLALLAGEAGWSLRAIALLALYNLAFIAPLVAVFVLAAFGAGSERMARWSKRNVVPSKIALGIVFLILGVLLCPRLGEGTFEKLLRRREQESFPLSESVPSHQGLRTQHRIIVPAVAHGLSTEELAERNRELDAQLRATVLHPDLPKRLVATVRSRAQDIQWRNYCVQVLPECWMRADVGASERAQLLETLRFALGERGTILCGTALLGLERIVEYSNDFAPELEEVLVSVAADALAFPENRTTALRLSADRGIRAVLPLARHWSRDGETSLLRAVADAAILDLDGREGR